MLFFYYLTQIYVNEMIFFFIFVELSVPFRFLIFLPKKEKEKKKEISKQSLFIVVDIHEGATVNYT